MTVAISGVVFDAADPVTLAEFWSQATGFPVEFSSPDFVQLKTDGSPGHFFLAKVPEPKKAKNRCHLDLETADVKAEVERLIGLGAGKIAEHTTASGFSWTVMQDPEGNEFCVSGAH